MRHKIFKKNRGTALRFPFFSKSTFLASLGPATRLTEDGEASEWGICDFSLIGDQDLLIKDLTPFVPLYKGDNKKEAGLGREAGSLKQNCRRAKTQGGVWGE